MEQKSIRVKAAVWTLLFIIVFVISALFCIRMLGAAPMKLLEVDWDDTVGVIYTDLAYENHCGFKYDLYLPADTNTENAHNLILYIHGGSFHSGAKEDGDAWCRYYTSKGYVAATLDYSLQGQQENANLPTMVQEISSCVSAVYETCLSDFQIQLQGMAACGVSAGGTLAMNYAYTQDEAAPVPVKFVFQLAGPSDFNPDEWEILMRVNHLDAKEEFVTWMTGASVTDEMLTSGEYMPYIDAISPARLINQHSVPTLAGYGLKDRLVPASSRILLKKALEENNVPHDFLVFPNCNHGMYRDLDVLQDFLDKSLSYCQTYFAGTR